MPQKSKLNTTLICKLQLLSVHKEQLHISKLD